MASQPPLAIDQTAANKDAAEQQGKTLDVGNGETVTLDALGPIIVNTDGTLSRIPNWHELSTIEQERTLRLIVKKRNKQRLQNLEDSSSNQGQ